MSFFTLLPGAMGDIVSGGDFSSVFRARVAAAAPASQRNSTLEFLTTDLKTGVVFIAWYRPKPCRLKADPICDPTVYSQFKHRIYKILPKTQIYSNRLITCIVSGISIV